MRRAGRKLNPGAQPTPPVGEKSVSLPRGGIDLSGVTLQSGQHGYQHKLVALCKQVKKGGLPGLATGEVHEASGITKVAYGLFYVNTLHSIVGNMHIVYM